MEGSPLTYSRSARASYSEVGKREYMPRTVAVTFSTQEDEKDENCARHTQVFATFTWGTNLTREIQETEPKFKPSITISGQENKGLFVTQKNLIYLYTRKTNIKNYHQYWLFTSNRRHTTITVKRYARC